MAIVKIQDPKTQGKKATSFAQDVPYLGSLPLSYYTCKIYKLEDPKHAHIIVPLIVQQHQILSSEVRDDDLESPPMDKSA